jgi:hypothetical protein
MVKSVKYFFVELIFGFFFDGGLKLVVFYLETLDSIISIVIEFIIIDVRVVQTYLTK